MLADVWQTASAVPALEYSGGAIQETHQSSMDDYCRVRRDQ